jgi:type II secretory pathway pseudopilin PulG
MLSRYRKQGFRSGKRSAFTLVEFLVIIAIITILAAILFSVFAQARAWQGLQFAARDRREAVIFLFRNDSAEATRRFALRRSVDWTRTRVMRSHI